MYPPGYTRTGMEGYLHNRFILASNSNYRKGEIGSTCINGTLAWIVGEEEIEVLVLKIGARIVLYSHTTGKAHTTKQCITVHQTSYSDYKNSTNRKYAFL